MSSTSPTDRSGDHPGRRPPSRSWTTGRSGLQISRLPLFPPGLCVEIQAPGCLASQRGSRTNPHNRHRAPTMGIAVSQIVDQITRELPQAAAQHDEVTSGRQPAVPRIRIVIARGSDGRRKDTRDGWRSSSDPSSRDDPGKLQPVAVGNSHIDHRATCRLTRFVLDEADLSTAVACASPAGIRAFEQYAELHPRIAEVRRYLRLYALHRLARGSRLCVATDNDVVWRNELVCFARGERRRMRDRLAAAIRRLLRKI